MRLEYEGPFVEGLVFPEAPRWRDGKLWFSDFYDHRVCSVGSDGVLTTVAHVPQQPSGLGWLPGGDLLVVSMLDRKVLRVSGETSTVHAELGDLAPAPCNDMLVLPDGVAYVGNFGFDRYAGEPQRSTVLARVDADGAVSIAATDVLFPNGCVVSADGSRLFLAESFANRITSFSIGPDRQLHGRSVHYQADGFFPDGICLDGDDELWACDPVSRRLSRIGSTGRLIDSHALPGNRLPIACVKGGDQLYVATNSALGPATALARQGRIDVFSPV